LDSTAESPGKVAVRAVQQLYREHGKPVRVKEVARVLGVSIKAAASRLERARRNGSVKRSGKGGHVWGPGEADCDGALATAYEQAAEVVRELYSGEPVPVRTVAKRLQWPISLTGAHLKEARRPGLVEPVGRGTSAGWIPSTESEDLTQ
jgi:predicted Rossmann fold nucleotide-binding protein DprA/Smf involved in DNA uptake